jgi:hypothetical protein
LSALEGQKISNFAHAVSHLKNRAIAKLGESAKEHARHVLGHRNTSVR